jgi:lipoprotein-releasing system permease protein
MTGLQGEIRSRILGATAHISVFRSGETTLQGWRESLDVLRRVPHVRGAAPVVYGKGLLTGPTGQAGLVTVKGVLPVYERQVTELGSKVVTGSLDALGAGAATAAAQPPVLLGQDLAETLGVAVGDVLTLTSSSMLLSPMGPLTKTKKLRVVGMVKSGLYEFDSAWAYIPLATAQRLFDTGEDGVSLIEVRIDDMYAVQKVSPSLLAALGPGYLTNDWIRMNQSLFSALWLEKIAISLTIGLIVMVAALNIVATLVLMVMEKHKDIGILVSMGASRRAISTIFVLQGAVIGSVGTLLGSLLGYGACLILDRFRLLRVPQDVYQVSYVPFKLLPFDALMVIVGALVVCLLATIHPARGASRLDPAEALRYE